MRNLDILKQGQRKGNSSPIKMPIPEKGYLNLRPKRPTANKEDWLDSLARVTNPENKITVTKEMHPRNPSNKVSQKGTGSTASKNRMKNLVDTINRTVTSMPKNNPGKSILKGDSPFPKTEPGSPRMKNLEKSHKQLQEAKSKLKPAVSFFRDRQIRNVLKK